MKVLIAGMQKPENQFKRALERYPNVQIFWTNPDPGLYNQDCDAVVIAKCMISHRKFWDVKDTYAKLGKPVFIADHSFSSIKERFEKFLDSKGIEEPEIEIPLRYDPPAKTALAHAFEAAEKEKQAEVIEATPGKRSGPDIMREMFEAGFENADILQMLHSENAVNKFGHPYKLTDIHTARYTWKNRGKNKSETPEASPSKPAKTKSPEHAPQNIVNLMNAVLGSNLSAEKKIEYVAQIQNGKMRSLEKLETENGKINGQAVLYIQMVSVLTGAKETILDLNKVQAMAVVKSIDAIKEFSELV